MCIAVVILNYSSRLPIIVAHNREEDMDRPTSDLMLKDGILSARDQKAGGVAAVGLDIKSGRFGILTNCRFRDAYRPDGLSRGSILEGAILSGPTHALVDHIKSQTFQGEFHMYVGELYVRNEIVVKYCTNIAESSGDEFRRKFDSNSPIEVIVRMNEHPCSQEDWQPKLQFVRNILLYKLSIDRNLDPDSVFKIVEDCLSITDPISSAVNGDFPWSPKPELESTALYNIIIPRTDLGTVHFGTVSQTVMVVDRDSRKVHYHYRPLLHAESQVRLGSWRTCLISFS